jgi:ketosteroid isomerase-like protein
MGDLRELSQRSLDAFNAHNANALAALDHEDVVFSAPGPTGRKEMRGRQASIEYNQAWFEAFPDARVTITNEVISGDGICTEGAFEGTNTGAWKSEAGDMPATGRTLKGHYCIVAKVKDGLFISSNLYFDQVEVLSQLGLMPTPVEVGA